jgi:hypothetical protein
LDAAIPPFNDQVVANLTLTRADDQANSCK